METHLRVRLDGLRARLDAEPDNADLLVQIGTLYEGIDDRERAVPFFERALQLDPSLTFLRAKVGPPEAPPTERRLLPHQRLDILPERPVLKPTRPYWIDALLAWRYPFSGHGVFILLTGALVLGFFRFFVTYSYMLLSILAVAFGTFFAAYMAVYYMLVVLTASYGRDDMPLWPDTSEMGTGAGNAARFGMGKLAAFFPALVCLAAAGHAAYVDVWPSVRDYDRTQKAYERGVFRNHQVALPPPPRHPLLDTERPTVFSALTTGRRLPWTLMAAAFAIAGAFYFPMALLANSLSGNPATAWNPVHIFGSIRRAMPEYLHLVVMTVATISLFIGVELTLNKIGRSHGGHDSKWLPIQIGLALIVSVVEVYVYIVLMRMIGLLYFHRRESLDWFYESRQSTGRSSA